MVIFRHEMHWLYRFNPFECYPIECVEMQCIKSIYSCAIFCMSFSIVTNRTRSHHQSAHLTVMFSLIIISFYFQLNSCRCTAEGTSLSWYPRLSEKAIRYELMQFITVHSMHYYALLECSPIWYCASQYSIVQYSTVQFTTVQYSTVGYIIQYCTVQ